MKKIQIEKQHQPLMERWVEALRSGEYIQGTSNLYKPSSMVCDEEYCCLGVLAELAGVPKEEMQYIEWIFNDLPYHESVPEIFRNCAEAPSILSDMNDGTSSLEAYGNKEWNLTSGKRRYNFTEIADFLEERLEYF